MAADSDFRDYVLDCMAATGMGPVENARLFGGTSFKIDGALFAVILRNTLYFVVDDLSRPRFEAAGMGPFTYARKNEQRVIPRWYELPEDVLLDAEDLRDWMREAMAAVRRTAKPAGKPRTSKTKPAAAKARPVQKPRPKPEKPAKTGSKPKAAAKKARAK